MLPKKKEKKKKQDKTAPMGFALSV